jgi:antitoxin component of RelBE/YafQ-DinJ toxin-antitoxin module
MTKNDLILLRCDKEEKQQTKRDAEEHGKTISDFIRYLVAKERKEREK